MMDVLKIPENEPIQAGILSKTIEDAQSKIEGMNFDIRKHLTDYDSVMNKHREVIYRKRREMLEKLMNKFMNTSKNWRQKPICKMNLSDVKPKSVKQF